MVSSMLANVPVWTSMDEWTKFPTQRSAPLLLVAGQPVLLEAVHCNQWSAGLGQVGVIVPSDQPR